MKAVITGATGFVGSALARRLVAEGVEVHALALPNSNRARLADSPIQWHVGDITRPPSLVHLFDGAQWIVHAAGMLGRAGVADETYMDVNAEGARHVLAAADHARAEGLLVADARVLHISSAGVLGPVRPQQKDQVFDETAPLAPSNAYERSKAQSEQYAAEFADAGLPVMVARPEFVYGPGDIHVLGIFQTIQRGLFFYIGDGSNTCHPTYIDDNVEGLWRILQSGRPGEIYHVTGPRPLPFRELAETIAAELGVSPPRLRVPRPLASAGALALETAGNLANRDVPLSRTGVAFFSESRRSSYAKAARELGYEPQVDLEEGVARSVAWYREQGLL